VDAAASFFTPARKRDGARGSAKKALGYHEKKQSSRVRYAMNDEPNRNTLSPASIAAYQLTAVKAAVNKGRTAGARRNVGRHHSL
jgi:hypothetical protein